MNSLPNPTSAERAYISSLVDYILNRAWQKSGNVYRAMFKTGGMSVSIPFHAHVGSTNMLHMGTLAEFGVNHEMMRKFQKAHNLPPNSFAVPVLMVQGRTDPFYYGIEDAQERFRMEGEGFIYVDDSRIRLEVMRPFLAMALIAVAIRIHDIALDLDADD